MIEISEEWLEDLFKTIWDSEDVPNHGSNDLLLKSQRKVILPSVVIGEELR